MGEVLVHQENLLMKKLGSPVPHRFVHYQIILLIYGDGHVTGWVPLDPENGPLGSQFLNPLSKFSKLIVPPLMYQHISTCAEQFHLWVLQHVEITMNRLSDNSVSLVSILKEFPHYFDSGVV